MNMLLGGERINECGRECNIPHDDHMMMNGDRQPNYLHLTV